MSDRRVSKRQWCVTAMINSCLAKMWFCYPWIHEVTWNYPTDYFHVCLLICQEDDRIKEINAKGPLVDQPDVSWCNLAGVKAWHENEVDDPGHASSELTYTVLLFSWSRGMILSSVHSICMIKLSIYIVNHSNMSHDGQIPYVNVKSFRII